MRWEGVLPGDRRIRRRFAWLPHRMNSSRGERTIIWLEFYWRSERYENDGYVLHGWFTVDEWTKEEFEARRAQQESKDSAR